MINNLKSHLRKCFKLSLFFKSEHIDEVMSSLTVAKWSELIYCARKKKESKREVFISPWTFPFLRYFNPPLQ